MRQICNKTTADRITDKHKYNRYCARFLLHDLCDKVGTGDDYVWFQADKLSGEIPSLGGIGASPTRIDPKIAAFDPARFSKRLPQCCSTSLSFWVVFAISQQQTK